MGLSDELDNAVIDVARCAQELVSGAAEDPRSARKVDHVLVNREDFETLKTALERWTKATQAWMEAQ